MNRFVIGVDFDNTIVTYDKLLHDVAVQRGLIPPDTGKNKTSIRDHIRRLPDGDIQWQILQGIVYGPRLGEAALNDGVMPFFESCRRKAISTYIVSHKTELSPYDETGTNLRKAAISWMTARGFFRPDGPGLTEENVYFCSDRKEKIERIVQLGCTHFIDDLEEVFLEKEFPGGVEKILYAPNRSGCELAGVRIARNWQEVCDYFFNAGN